MHRMLLCGASQRRTPPSMGRPCPAPPAPQDRQRLVPSKIYASWTWTLAFGRSHSCMLGSTGPTAAPASPNWVRLLTMKPLSHNVCTPTYPHWGGISTSLSLTCREGSEAEEPPLAGIGLRDQNFAAGPDQQCHHRHSTHSVGLQGAHMRSCALHEWRSAPLRCRSHE